MNRKQCIIKYEYRVGRIPGVGPNLAKLKMRRVGPDAWIVERIRNLGSNRRAMNIATLIGRR